MTVPSTRVLVRVQSGILFVGTIFAWSKLIPQLTNFYAAEGTFLSMGGAVPNPFLTACLYGSLAFIAALYASVRLYLVPTYRGERLLRNFLIFSVVFAGSVVLSEVAEYYKLFDSAVSVTCSPGVPPTQTPCFTGMLFFLAALAVAEMTTKREKSY